MSRSRRHEDDGILGEAFAGLFALSRTHPLLGVALGLIFLVLGFMLYAGPGRRVFFGLGWAFGLVAFLVGLLLILFAIANLFRRASERLRRNALRAAVPGAAPATLAEIQSMPAGEFEQLVADLFRRQGYRVDEVAGQPDGGVDLLLHHDSEPSVEHVVQCKRHRSWSIGEPEIREFYGLMVARLTGCEGIIVTGGRFTPEAVQFTAGKPIRLIDGPELISLLRSVNAISPADSQNGT